MGATYYMNPVISLDLIQTLIVFSDQKSLVKTARILKTTQPTISRHFKRLQELLPYPLFEQIGRNKVLTPYAKKIVERFRDRFKNIEDVFNDIISEQENSSDRVKIKIGGRSDILKKHFGIKQFEGVLHLESMNGLQVVDAIKQSKIDIGITQHDILTSDYIRKVLFQDFFCLIIPKKYLKNKNDYKKWLQQNIKENNSEQRDQMHCSYCAYCSYYDDQSFLKKQLAYLDLQQNLTAHFICDDWNFLEKRVAMGINWSIIPSLYLLNVGNSNSSNNESLSKYHVIEIKSDVKNVFYIYYRKRLSRFEWFKKLIL